MTRTLLALAFTTAIGCGSSTGGGPSGVDGSKQVTAVTDSEKGMLCDWFTAMVGGYGAVSSCEIAQLEAPPDKAACLTDFPACAVPVSVFEACVTALAAAGKACTEAAVAQAVAKPECQTVGEAGCFGQTQ